MSLKSVKVRSDFKVCFHPRAYMRRKNLPRTLHLPTHIGAHLLEALPVVPATCDWTRGGKLSFPMDGNDQYGDCYYTAACHASNTWTGNVGVEDTFDTAAIVAAYLKLSGGDNGLDTDEIMSEWKRGLCGGPHKILADMSVNPNNTAAMRAAIDYYGGVPFTLAVPDAWMSDALCRPGAVWDAGAGVSPNQDNGHAVWLNGYNALGFTLQTWGFNPPITITPAGIALCDPAAEVVISLDWFNSAGVAPNKLTYDQLASVWATLGGGNLPPWVSPLPPTPQPPTPTPPQPQPWLERLQFNAPVAAGRKVTFVTPVLIPAGVYALYKVLQESYTLAREE